MNEAETRAELIDPLLRDAGWGVVEGSKVLREHHITKGRIMTGGLRAKPEIADYILVYNNPEHGVVRVRSLPRVSFIVRDNLLSNEPIHGFTYDNWPDARL